ncbi:MAG TPA: DNA-processing protein DprA [Ktedonobacteraceae bacterium]
MVEDLREQACWLLLAFENGLSTRVVNNIVVAWCHQHKRSMQEFFAADAQEWMDVCNLSADVTQKLEQAKEKLVGQAFLVEQLAHNNIHILSVLDTDYPKLLKTSLKREQTPPVLFYAGDLQILERKTIAVIGSRNAGAKSLEFTRAISSWLAEKGANVISGNARGVDRAAYEGATGTDGCTTVVLPHGIRKLSGVQMRALQSKIESGNVLLMSQFHPDAQWVVSRAMERNKVVTGLAQVVIVAESDVQGGTWEGANGALKQHRPLYVRQSDAALPGNNKLIELGGQALPWPVADVATLLSPILQESAELQQEKQEAAPHPDQLSLFATSNE